MVSKLPFVCVCLAIAINSRYLLIEIDNEIEQSGFVSAGLKNSGKKCWNECKEKQGPCAYCGTGICCRKEYADTSKGCYGQIGGDGQHECVAKPGPCPYGWFQPGPKSSSCFQIVAYPNNYYATDSYCRKQGGKLAEPVSFREHEMLTSTLPVYDMYWIGLNSNLDYGKFVWGSNGKSPSYQNWGTNYPTEIAEGKCVAIRWAMSDEVTKKGNFTWQNENCDKWDLGSEWVSYRKLYGICQKPMIDYTN